VAQPLPELRPRGIVDLLDATVRLYRRHFATLLGVSAVLLIPFGVASTVGSYYLTLAFEPLLTYSAPPVGFQPDLTQTAIGVVGFSVSLLIAWIVGPLSQGALAITISEQYLGRTITIGEAYRRARPYWGSLFVVSLVFGLIVSIGPLAGVLLGGLVGVPLAVFASPDLGLALGLLLGGLGLLGGSLLGIVFVVWFFLYDTVMVVEGIRGMDSLQRARALVRSYFWHALGAMFLVFLGTLLVAMIATGPISVAASLLASWRQELFAPLQLVSQCIQQIVGILIGPVTMITQTLLYYDLRIKQEGFDLQQMAEALRQRTGNRGEGATEPVA